MQVYGLAKRRGKEEEDGWASVRFFFLEDRSGGERNGPIEDEQRVKSVNSGLIRDMMPHIPAVLQYFGDLTTFRVTQVRSALYTGIDNIPGKPTEIERETFAEAKFEFEGWFEGSSHKNIVEGVAYIGKGVRGVREPILGHNIELKGM